ncbi:MAG: rhodanese-like domain-containing protein [Candidatus Aenigmarchaeota archaeon]|nr:rhodanese-like domain-containing protein [Candidatus Aenigmarchaeota archaeon]
MQLSTYKIAAIIIALSITSSISAIAVMKSIDNKTQNELIEDFYLTENAVHVSPHSIRKSMDKGDQNFILVDLRSQEEYEKEHIIGAVNIPAYKDKDTSDYGAVDRIVSSFKELNEKNPRKDIVVYCYSIPCMTGRKIGKMLAEHDIYVKSLGIGWNEWRYFWDSWNHEHEWNQTNVLDYISSGKDPGIPKLNTNSTACKIEGSLSC